MSNLNVTNIQHESGAGNNLILTADGTTTIPGGTNRPQIAGYQQGLWTPGFVSGDDVTGIQSIVRAVWTRSGNTVVVQFSMFMEGTGNYQVGDQIIINGLPYRTWDNGGTTGISAVSASSTTFAQFLTLYSTGNQGLAFRCTATVGGVTKQGRALFGNFNYITDDTTWAPQNGATLG